MYRGLRSLNATSVTVLLAVAAVALGTSHPCHAADTKVVLEQFSGAGATKFRDQVKKALRDLKVDVVPDKKLAATEADLGLMQASDSYGAVAAQLGATHFVSGSGGGKKPSATLVVKDSSGKKSGQKVFRGNNAKQLDAAIAKRLQGALAELLGTSGGSAAVAAAPVVAAAPAAKVEKQAAKEEKRVAKEEKKAAQKPAKAAPAASDDEDDADDEDDEDDEDGDDRRADAQVKASASPSSGSSGWKGLDAWVGAFIYSRQFAYNQKRQGNQEEYKTDPVAPAVAANIDYFFLPYVGLSVGGDFTVGLSSAKGNTTFGTTAMTFYAGPKGKMNFGPLEVNVLAAFAKQSFQLEDQVGDVESNVPNADYTMVRAVLGARMDLGVVGVFGSFGYNHVLSMGAFTDAFPNATAAATEGSLGVSVPLGFLLSGLDFRAAVFGRQFGISMNSRPNDTNTAGGATDKYLGGLLTVGYRTN